jgi:hypothetical protein
MRMKTILKENTTLGCRESFLLENHTMTRGEDHPWLEMLVDHLRMDELYLLTMVAVDLSAEVVIGF